MEERKKGRIGTREGFMGGVKSGGKDGMMMVFRFYGREK